MIKSETFLLQIECALLQPVPSERTLLYSAVLAP